MSEPILQIEGLNAHYGSAHVVQDVSFDVLDEPVCVIGRNGSLTGYAGGLPRKQQLLELEGVLQPKQVRLPF